MGSALSYVFLGDHFGEGGDAYAPHQIVAPAVRCGNDMVELQEWFRFLEAAQFDNTTSPWEKRIIRNRIRSMVLVNPAFCGRWLHEPQLVVRIEVLRR